MTRIVVTGALGHIGSRLIRDLPAHLDGGEIVMVDNLATQRYPSLFALPHGHYRFVEADVCEAPLEPIFEGADAVVHLAALTDAAGSFARRDEVERVNLISTTRVAAACRAVGAGLIYPSSTSVYGTQNALVDEDCGIEDLKPQSPYAETKLREEAELAEEATRGLRHIVCRFGTIFGTSPGMRFHTAVNKFCWQASMGVPLTVWTTAYDQKRPYLDLGDAVQAMGVLIEGRHFDGGIYNVLSQNATVRDVVDAIRVHIPDVQVSFVDTEIMNQLSYEVANQKIQRLGVRFAGSIEAGVAETLRLLADANAAARPAGA